MKILMITLAAAVVLGAVPSPADAEPIVCNKFSAPIYVAIGYQTLSDFKARGWWEVGSGACATVYSCPVELPFYVYAETKTRPMAGGATIQDKWGKGKRLVVTSDKFNYIKADQIAAKDRAEEFTKVSDGNDGLTKVTYTIVDGRSSETRRSP